MSWRRDQLVESGHGFGVIGCGRQDHLFMLREYVENLFTQGKRKKIKKFKKRYFADVMLFFFVPYPICFIKRKDTAWANVHFPKDATHFKRGTNHYIG
jgi:hypothetical protein